MQDSGLNFIGNVEGKELFGGEADVVVTDGFTGNVLLEIQRGGRQADHRYAAPGADQQLS